MFAFAAKIIRKITTPPPEKLELLRRKAEAKENAAVEARMVEAVKEHWWAIIAFETIPKAVREVAKETEHGEWYLRVYDKYGHEEAKKLMDLAKKGYDLSKIENASETIQRAAVKKDPRNIQFIEHPSHDLCYSLIVNIDWAFSSHLSPDKFKSYVEPLLMIRNCSETIQLEIMRHLNSFKKYTIYSEVRNCCEEALAQIRKWNPDSNKIKEYGGFAHASSSILTGAHDVGNVEFTPRDWVDKSHPEPKRVYTSYVPDKEWTRQIVDETQGSGRTYD